MPDEPPELDDFGLPVRKCVLPATPAVKEDGEAKEEQLPQAPGQKDRSSDGGSSSKKAAGAGADGRIITPFKEGQGGGEKAGRKKEVKDEGLRVSVRKEAAGLDAEAEGPDTDKDDVKDAVATPVLEGKKQPAEPDKKEHADPVVKEEAKMCDKEEPGDDEDGKGRPEGTKAAEQAEKVPSAPSTVVKFKCADGPRALGISEFSHQQLTARKDDKGDDGNDDGGWQTMPAYAAYDMYDDDNRLVAREYESGEEDKEKVGYAGLGGAGKGYTRVVMDDDAESATSMDDNTQYLFNRDAGSTSLVAEEEEVQRDAVSQLQATKDLLTEGQRIAYVGLTRLELSGMVQQAKELEEKAAGKGSAAERAGRRGRKELQLSSESLRMWSQWMMVRLYAHMDIDPAEQVMIEQLSAHGVVPRDLTPVLMANARVKNPMGGKQEGEEEGEDGDEDDDEDDDGDSHRRRHGVNTGDESVEGSAEKERPVSKPVRMPSQLGTEEQEDIEIDLRWTVLCDLFLVLIADSVYDARSRVLLERVGASLEVPWIDMCKFEKKVTDALEMQQQAERENWNEDQHMATRRKLALKRRYVMMGLATVGGGLVIGLSAGLLAPVIGAGLAAGFTTIGVSGTSGFLAGTGGAAIITSSAAASGSIIGVRAANRRTGSVRTFEYRPLHNNKRVNLIVTVAGWMTGKIDDVRLPFSTVDPVMGDLYSVLWEPEMLTSMGDTINILATEALTQGLQQLLGSTILVSLMAALQLPVVLTKLAYLIDNPWAVSLDRATMAGLILADSLIDRNLGTRPVTLVGFSLGSRLIFSCLLELARKGAVGLVQNVYLFGSPIVVKREEYLRARGVVAGRFVNGYNRNDWILGYLFRLTSGGIRRVAGLAPVDDVPRLENIDVTAKVVGHMDYRKQMPKLLRECDWLVQSDDFTEIEDPDPEKHQDRQRVLISEIEEARKEMEIKNAKGGRLSSGTFSFFRRKKGLQKQEWEVYEDSTAKGEKKVEGGGYHEHDDDADRAKNQPGVLFDVDAMRAELAKEREENKAGDTKRAAANASANEEGVLQIREIKSTLPPMKLDLRLSSSASNANALPSLAPPMSTGRSLPDALREALGEETRNADTSRPYQPRASQDLRSTTVEHRASFELRYASAAYTSKSHNDYYHGHHDDEIQMTFDTSFNNLNHNAHGCNTRRPRTASSANDVAPSLPPPKDKRLEVETVQTVPNIVLQDPWTQYEYNKDDDEEDFGKEKEMTLTFA